MEGTSWLDPGGDDAEPVRGGEGRIWIECAVRSVPTVDEFTRLLERMMSEGLLTSEEASSHARMPVADSIAELAAKVQALDIIAEAHRAGES